MQDQNIDVPKQKERNIDFFTFAMKLPSITPPRLRATELISEL